MSQKNQPRCVVMVEPMVNLQTEKMDNLTKESSKKKQPKEEKKAPAAKDIVPAESTSNGGSKDTETAQSQENGVSNGVSNGKSSKKEKSKNENGAVTNGVSDVALNAAAVPDVPSACSPSDPTSAELNPDIIEEDALVQHLEQDNDELFTELNYDENSDNECSFDSTSPNFSPVGRSATRRSQAKKIPTPETPQLPSKGDTPEVTEVPRSPSRHTPDQTTPLREKVFKMKEQYTPIRVSPAPDTARSTRDTESPTADREEDCESKNGSTPTSETGSAKSDTNFSKSRIKVSPYRRSSRISEQFSIMANYSGNNTTQQTELIGDISSSSRDPSGDPEQSGESTGEKSFSESLKCIKGRRSYRHLREYSLRNLSAQRQLRGYKDPDQENRDVSISSVNATVGSNSPCDTVSSDSSSTKWTPVGHVVGRKRRQDSCEEARPTPSPSVPHLPAHSPSPALLLDGERPSKRARLLGYVATPLRHLREKITSSTPIHFGNRTAHKAEPLLVPSLAGDEVTAEEEMPMVADILPCKPETGPEHKWCSIM